MRHNEYMKKHLSQLIGKTVIAVVPDDDEEMWALVFTDKTSAWILRDEEGNGPGHLDIVKDD